MSERKPVTPISVRLDAQLRADLEALAEIDRRSLSWELKEAARLMVKDRQEEISVIRRQSTH